jgi:hypothetical protein
MTRALLYLEWIDSASSDGWQPLAGYEHGPIYIQSVGWLIHEDDAVVTLASNIGRQANGNDPNQACGWISIPKAAITQRRVMRKR